MAERERLAGVAGGVRAAARQVQQPRGERGERQQIEPVVLEHGFERPRIAAPHELKIAPGDLESRHVADSWCADDITFERLQRAALSL